MTLDLEWRKGKIFQGSEPWCELRWVDKHGYARHLQMPEELADALLEFKKSHVILGDMAAEHEMFGGPEDQLRRARELLQSVRPLLLHDMDVWRELDEFLR